MNASRNELSAPAAIDLQRIQRSGFRGSALVRDNRTGNLVVFEIGDRGAKCRAAADVAPVDSEHAIALIPGLIANPDASASDIFSAIESALTSLASWTVH